MATKEVRQKEVARILNRDGEVKASVLLKESKPVKSPLHDEFEWDDEAAAHQHRLSTARRIIKTTSVVSESGVRQRLVHVPSVSVEGPTASHAEREGGYKLVSEVVKRADEYQRALRQLQTQVAAIEGVIRDLKKHAGESKESLLPTLEDAMLVARNTVRLMLEQPA